MLDKWNNIHKKNLWKFWQNGWFEGFMTNGFLDSSPLVNLINEIFTDK